MENAKAGQKKLERPLEGIRIVEYGVFHAGPGGNAILGDLGAEVIKIENQAGDPERYWTTVAGFDLALNNEESIIFEASNRSILLSSMIYSIRFSPLAPGMNGWGYSNPEG